MNIAVTGATGFLGRYIVNHLLAEGHSCRCWHRPGSDRGGFLDAPGRLEWLAGELGNSEATEELVRGMDAVIHAALHRPGRGFRGAEGDLAAFAEKNIIGSLRLMQAARSAGVRRFVFISTCAVHERVLDDRPLDETHPLWPTSHYGAHKAAIEKFVHSFGLGDGWEICALRPTGIYGLARPATESKWFGLVQDVRAGRPVDDASGGKEVHAADVARATALLLTAPGIAGQAYNCYDLYVSAEHVARLTREITGSESAISSRNRGPRHQIETSKLRALGMNFGGEALLRTTVQELLRSGEG